MKIFSSIFLLTCSIFLFSCTSAPRQSAGQLYCLEAIHLGGMDQWILIQGNSPENPVLLWLHGGPGSAQMPVSHHYDRELLDHFTIVHWDQRGAGKSNPRDFDESTLTFQQFIRDAHDLTGMLKKRFKTEKIYLIGHSWGSQMGIVLAARYPEDYYAYIGMGQLVDPGRGQVIAHKWLSGQIEKSGKSKDRKRLDRLGDPPYPDHDDYVDFIHLVDACGGGFDISFAKMIKIAFKSPEYKTRDYLAWLRGANRGSGPMWEASQKFRASEAAPEIDIPVYFFNGKNDYNTPLELVREYYTELKAPKGKHLVVFENSAHTPCFGEPEEFNRWMIQVEK